MSVPGIPLESIESAAGDVDITLRQRIIHASFWSLISEVGLRLLSFVILIIQLRLLLPGDFGKFAIISGIVSFMLILWESGLSQAVVVMNDQFRKSATAVYVFSSCIAAFLYAVLYLCADTIAHYFVMPELVPGIRIAGLAICAASISTIGIAILRLNLDFRAYGVARLYSTAIAGLVSIALAWYGYGYWALVLGSVVGQVFVLIIVLRCVPLWSRECWHFYPAIDVFRKALVFSFEGFLKWFYTWFDSLVIAHYLGVVDSGLYRTGNFLVMTGYALLLSPILPVLFSTFSQLRNDQEGFYAAYRRALRGVSMICLPAAVVVSFVFPATSHLLLGSRWAELSVVVSTCALFHGLSWMVGVNAEAFRAIGRPDLNIKIMLAALCYYLPGYIYGAQQGFLAFLCIRLLLTCVTIPLHLTACHRVLNISPWTVLNETRSVILGALGLALVFVISDSMGMLNSAPGLFITVLIGLASYIYLDREDFLYMYGLILYWKKRDRSLSV